MRPHLLDALRVNVLFVPDEFSCSINAFFWTPSSFAKPANKPGLHQLGQNRIAEQHDGQIEPIQRWEWNKPERARQRRNRQPGTDGHDDQGGEDERPASNAGNERSPVIAQRRSYRSVTA